MSDLHDERAAFEDAFQPIMAHPECPLRRLMVLDETLSTQNDARAHAVPGLVVVALRQTSGRGRLGRAWADTGRDGLAITFVLDLARTTPEQLSLVCGLAAARACRAVLPSEHAERIRLRWPNDVVVRGGEGPERKLAGVLIERSEQLAFAGIGINVRQESFPPELAPRATSLRQLGSAATRAQTAGKLATELVRLVQDAPSRLNQEWESLDILVGTERTFIHDGQSFRGRVKSLDPIGRIVLVTTSGDVVLPALSTSLMHQV
jgi:BirA family biotin operon repressor/biotin-[acetyl-CoA-carboxylase] ligase